MDGRAPGVLKVPGAPKGYFQYATITINTHAAKQCVSAVTQQPNEYSLQNTPKILGGAHEYESSPKAALIHRGFTMQTVSVEAAVDGTN